jgi:quercetin dioxygenase-like cupin family protein
MKVFPLWAWASLALIILCGTVAGSHLVAARAATQTAQKENERARLAFSHALPRLSGDKLSVSVVEVNYAPGESSMPHTHLCPVIGYVLEGTLRTQAKGEPETIYKIGESFYEAPNGVHLVSANPSHTTSTKLLAYFVCDHDTPLSVAVSEAQGAGGK